MIFFKYYRIVHAAKNAYTTRVRWYFILRRYLISAAPVSQSLVHLGSPTLTRTIRVQGFRRN